MRSASCSRSSVKWSFAIELFWSKSFERLEYDFILRTTFVMPSRFFFASFSAFERN